MLTIKKQENFNLTLQPQGMKKEKMNPTLIEGRNIKNKNGNK